MATVIVGPLRGGHPRGTRPQSVRPARRRAIPAVKTVIVEDHLLFSDVLRTVCTRDLGHEVVGVAADGPAAVELVRRHQPDLLLLDLQLPGLDGFGVLEAVRRDAPRIQVLLLSSLCDAYTVYRAERARVKGFVDKNASTLEAVAAAIRSIAAGRVHFSDAFLAQKAARHADPGSFDKVLSDRECQVLELIGQPMSDREVADRLGLAVATVEKHRFNILAKLGCATTVELVRYAQDRGFTLARYRPSPPSPPPGRPPPRG